MPDRWAQIQDVYHRALERDESQRNAFVADICAGDEELRREVESLLRYAGDAQRLMEKPALEIAAQKLATHDRRNLEGLEIGPYKILSLLGSGGMGEVYQARDSRLKRDVAIKVLPVEFSCDAGRVQRFQREAELLASLNHPNIAAIYDLEEFESSRFLVLELVDGETLADRIARAPIALDESLAIARQIAEALDAAHQRGIIHRDLKPANIKIKPDGTVKVLDFGLAKAFADDQKDRDLSHPLTSAGTEGGLILGTVAYMSPEQSRGKAVDKRTDVWSFGCVLYEMLSGKQPFRSESTVSDTLAAILKAEPDWKALPAETTTRVRTLIERCLQKDLRRRLPDIAEARIQIEEALSEPSAGIDTQPSRKSIRTQKLWMTIAGVLALTAIGLLLGQTVVWNFRFSPTANAGRVMRLSTGFQPGDALVGRPPWAVLAISPDGRYLAFQAQRGNLAQLYLRALDETEAKPIPGTEGAVDPFFSPDSHWVGFSQAGKLKKVAMAGGPPIVLCDVPSNTEGSWTSNDTILFSAYPEKGIWEVPASGGAPKRLIEADLKKNEMAYLSPQMLPGGKTLLFTVRTSGSWDEAQIVAQSTETGQRHILIRGGASGRYVPSGHLIYLKAGVLMAVPFDTKNLEVQGGPVSLIDGVMQSINMPNTPSETGVGQFSISDTGTLVSLSGGIRPKPKSQFVLRDRRGHENMLSLAPAGVHYTADLPGGFYELTIESKE
jgi:serine/threonine protein kinase